MTLRTIAIRAAAAALVLALSGPGEAQLALPGRIDPLDTLERVGDTVHNVAERVVDPLASAAQGAADRLDSRLARLQRFVAGSRGAVEWDDRHEPARAGEVLLLDPDAQSLARAQKAGFVSLEQGTIGDLGIAYARLAVPRGQSLAAAVKALRAAVPGHEVSADTIHFESGAATRAARAPAGATQLPRGGTVGVIDGGVAGSDRVVAQKGFAAGAPHASQHASAIVSLLKGAGTARIVAADVYGTDPAGGGALAIARAIGWMTGQGVRTISISLVGPANPLLARTIAAARGRGAVVVAAVGNDGPAAPPAYPASYPGVVAVTGVDGRGRVLIEAGRASHIDYAAPGADMTATIPGKGRTSLRGTSFAAPLAAARIAARMAGGAAPAEALKGVDGEARGASRRTGRGVLCMDCRTGI